MSGPVGGFFTSLLGEMSGANEFSVFIDETQKKAILKGLFENYYAAQKDKVVFDTNRLWCTQDAGARRSVSRRQGDRLRAPDRLDRRIRSKA